MAADGDALFTIVDVPGGEVVEVEAEWRHVATEP